VHVREGKKLYETSIEGKKKAIPNLPYSIQITCAHVSALFFLTRPRRLTVFSSFECLNSCAHKKQKIVRVLDGS